MQEGDPAPQDLRNEIPSIVEKIVSLHDQGGRFSHASTDPIPSKESVIDIIERAFRIIYPGYFTRICLDAVNIPYYFGQEVLELFQVLSDQIAFAIRHDCRRFDLVCTNCEERGQRAALNFLNDIPQLQAMLAEDVIAAFEGDPAAKYHDEIIFSYPGLFTVSVYRIAHHLHMLEYPLFQES